MKSWPQTLVAMTADSTAYTASTTPTTILHPSGKYQFDPNDIYVGKVLHIRAAGRITTVTTPGTLTLAVRLGSVDIAASAAMTLNATAKTNVPWWLEWFLTARAIGGSTNANWMHQGIFGSEAIVGGVTPATGGVAFHMMPNSAPAVGTGYDSSAEQTLDLFATWGTNNANSIQTHQYRVVEE